VDKLIIDLMRHGEPVGGRRYRGQTVDPLSEKGWQQMWAAVDEFRGWQQIVTSPLQRCAAFAEALADKLGVQVVYDERLKEAGFGEWEGLTAAEICAEDAQRIQRFKHDPVQHGPKNGEPLALFHQRIGQAWDSLLQAHRGRHILVVAHAGVIRMLMAQALDLSPQRVYRINIENAALTRIQVEFFGDVALPTLMFHAGKP
jgi:alpha-ribazole phosphatase/probable phosphoglycerate mutase